MNDFFQTIYDNALNTGALNHNNNPEYRRAVALLEELAEDKLHLDHAAQNELMNAVYAVLCYTDLETLSYGFRLGVRVTAPDCL